MRDLARSELGTSGGMDTPSEIYDDHPISDTESFNFLDDWDQRTNNSSSFDADKITTIKSAPLITVLHRKKSSYMPATFRA